MKKLAHNSNAIRKSIEAHILECIVIYNDESEDGDKYFDDIQDACQHLNDEFCRVASYPYNLKMFPNPQKRFIDYLSGLPFRFLYLFEESEEFLTSINLRWDEKASYEHSLNTYRGLIYKVMVKNLKEKYND